jgi:hypothetical protein
VAQRTEEHQFLFEAPALSDVDALTAELVALYNARLRLGRLLAEAAELATYGPVRPPEQQARARRQRAQRHAECAAA